MSPRRELGRTLSRTAGPGGNWESALALLQRNYYELAHWTGRRWDEGRFLAFLAKAYHRRGDVERAVRLFNLAGAAHRDRGDLEGAARAFESALALRQAQGRLVRRATEKGETAAQLGQAMCQANLGVVLAGLGQVDRARECLEDVLAMYEATGFPGAERVRQALAKLPPPGRLQRVIHRLLRR